MKKLNLTLIFLCVLQLSYAQETIPSTGGNASGTGGVSNYTVGQLVYTTNISTSGSVSQGVQQAFEFQTLSNPGLLAAQLTAVTYPNPTTDFIVLKITDTTLKNLQYTLFDLNGKTIARNPIRTSSTEIPMKNLSIGMYLLKLTKKNKPLKTFKVIKKQ
jgi:hypothetical protein